LALKKIYHQPAHDGANVRPSVFSALHTAEIDEDFKYAYFADISRQAEALIRLFRQQGAWSQNLEFIADVVEFFYTAYLSRSTVQAISKLVYQNTQQQELSRLYEQMLQKSKSGVHGDFCDCLIKLILCGEFSAVIQAIRLHPEFNAQDLACKKVIDEIDSI